MSRDHNYYVYIMSSKTKVLYIGVTNDIIRRILEHKLAINKSFSSKYKTFKLVYYEHHGDIYEAIAREKKLKKWCRAKKIWLIEERNPRWEDLAFIGKNSDLYIRGTL